MENDHTLRNFFAVLIVIVVLYYGTLAYNRITLIKSTIPEYSEMSNYEVLVEAFTNNN